MAKKVNKKFVVILGAAIASAAALGAVGVLYNRWKPQDPNVLKAKAEEYEKAQEFANAADMYNRAAIVSSLNKAPGTDQLFLKLSDVSMQASRKAKNPAEGVRFYQISRAALQRALVENANNRQVNERLMEGQYEEAKLVPFSQKGWTTLEESMNGFLARTKDPAARHFLYRAEARLRRVQIGNTQDVPESRIADIEADIKKALAIEPENAKAVALSGEVGGVKSRRAKMRSADAEAETLLASAQQSMKDFLKKHPNDPEVVEVLAGSLIYQADQTNVGANVTLAEHAKSVAPILDAAIEVSVAAFNAHPENVRLSDIVARLYLRGNPPLRESQNDLAEEVYKKLIAAAPKAAENYLRLARFYERTGKFNEAIAAYQECLNHQDEGGGLESIKNDELQRGSYHGIAALKLEQAEQKGYDTPEGAALVADAEKNIDKLRSARDWTAIVNLLDARVQFLKRNLPQASSLLRSAEAAFKNNPNLKEQYCQTLLMLASVNLMQAPPQLGAALQYTESALTILPGQGDLLVRRAQILNRLGRYTDVQASMKELLQNEKVLPPKLVEGAKSVLAASYSGVGNPSAAAEIYNELDNTQAFIQLAWAKIAAGDLEGAASDAERGLVKEPTNTEALRVAAIANARLEKKDVALKYVERALAKNPKDTQFQVLKGVLTQNSPSSPQAQESIISAITDDYTRNLQLAMLFRARGDFKREIEALRAAETAVASADTIEGRQKQGELVDRIFSAYAASAITAKDPAVKNDMWKGAEAYVQKAEQKNVDGVKGKLFRGRLELMRTNGASGLDLIESAVHDRSDYAFAQSILGQAYAMQNRFDNALDAYRAANKLSPNNVSYIVLAADLLVRKADKASIAEAQSLVQKGIQFAPRDPRLAQFADLVAMRTGSADDLAKAIKTREEIHKSSPENDANTRMLAIMYVQNKANDPAALDKAVSLVRPLYTRDKNNLEIIAQLSGIYAEQGEVDEGVRLFEGVISSTDPAVRYQALIVFGEFCKRVGRTDQAIASFRDAAGIRPKINDDAERHLADLYFDIDNMALAETTYQAVVEAAKPGQSRALAVRRLIESQIRQKKYAVAEAALDKEVFAESPKDQQGLVLRAYSRIQQNRVKEAIADLDAVLAINRENADALYYRALANFTGRGNLDQARDDLLRVIGRDPSAMNARILLAQVYRSSRRFAEAVNEYSELLKVHPELLAVRRDFAQFLMELAGVQQRLSEFSTDDFSITIKSIKPADTLRALLRDSMSRFRDQAIWVLMTAELDALTNNVRDAQAGYERIYRLLPDDPVAANAYVKSLLQTRNYEDALAVVSKAIAKRPEILDLYIRRATALTALKRNEEASADIDRALQLSAENAKQTKGYDTYLSIVDQAAAAVPAGVLASRLQLRIGADPEEHISTIALVHVLLSADRAPDALSLVANSRVPADNKMLRYLFTKEAGMVYYQTKKYPEAQKAFEEALQIAPDDYETLNNYAFLLADGLNRAKDAIPLIDRAQQALNATANPGALLASTANLADTSGWVRHLAGDNKGAIFEFGRAILAQPMPVTYLHLAKVHRKMSDDPTLKSSRDLNLKLAREAVENGLRYAAGTSDPVASDLEKLQQELGK